MVENVKELLRAHEGLRREVYLDNENSTMVPQEVLDAMAPYYLKRAYGNPTLTHKPGWEAFETIMECSQSIANSIGSKAVEEINFTPGETEANNLALMGTLLQEGKRGKKLVTSEIEPINVLHVSDLLRKYGFTTTRIPVNDEGFVDLRKLADVIDGDTSLVSLSIVNNEIGTIQPVKEAVKIAKERNPRVLFHIDASDAYGRIPLNVHDLGADLVTLSSYKVLGPRGIGVLYVKEGVGIDRLLEGQFGTQRLWPGVENTPLIVGFAKASELAFTSFDQNVRYMTMLRDKLASGIMEEVRDVLFNGPRGQLRVCDNVNVSFLRCEGEAFTIEASLKGVYVSSGSACTRRLLQPSHVLAAIGRRFDEAHGSILMKVTRYHTEEDINFVLEVIPKAVERIRTIVGSTAVE